MNPIYNSSISPKTLFLLIIALCCVMSYIPYKLLSVPYAGLPAHSLDVDSILTMSLPLNITVDKRFSNSGQTRPVIAIGSGITSRMLKNVSEYNVGIKFQFFNSFLPTFCNTASPQYIYRIYLAFDNNDEVFANQLLRDAFKRHFYGFTATGSCGNRRIITSLSLVQCDYTGKPAWAQNDAMLEAYLDHVDYFYRINDDTKLLTKGWAEKFISTLENYDPPRVGVVGPKTTGGHIILIYDFVHRTHIDIFGFYYPRLFTDWFADRWITLVYKPNRSTKLLDVRLIHTMSLGRRYNVHFGLKIQLGHHLAKDTALINR